MSSRSLARLWLNAFVPLSALGLWAACSSDTTNFFGAPNLTAGSSGKGDTTGGTGASSGADSGVTGGASGTTGGTGTAADGGSGAAGGSKARGGSAGSSGPHAGTGGDGPNGGTGGTDVSGQGGAEPNGGMGGDGSSGEMNGGADGTAGDPGGGMAGDGVSGGGGSAGSTAGTGGSAGNTAGAGGSAGSTAGSAGTAGGGAGAGGSAGGPPSTCDHDTDCSGSQYCKKATCESVTGVCTARATSCTGSNAVLAPVCGCDHITYYTSCVAEREGVNVTASGECGNNAATCTRTGGGASCSPSRTRAACFRKRTSCSGSTPSSGVCWVLPESCPNEESIHLYCNAGNSQCRSFCDALEDGIPLIRNSSSCD